MKAVVFLSVAVLATGLTIAKAEGPSSPGAIYTEFDAMVRETLLKHPEIMLEVFAKLEAEQAAATVVSDKGLIDQNLVELFGPYADETPPVVVEFLDYRCSFCRAQEDRIKEVVTEEVLVIRKHLPILGPESLEAAAKMIAIEMIYGSELSEQMHTALMGGGVPLARFDTQATSLGIDPRRVSEMSRSAAVQETIAATRDLAQRLGIDGTPGIVTRTRIFRGMVDGADLHSAVFESVK